MNKSIALIVVGFLLALILILGRNMNSNNKNAFLEIDKTLEELNSKQNLQTAVFAGGCFWCMEGPFEQIEGVEAVVTGYTGGIVENPNYEEVIAGNTGHREAIKVYYDPKIVDYEKLLETYWPQIDPTDAGGQFADRGEQYRTGIYYKTEEQKKVAEKSKIDIGVDGRYEGPVVTEILQETIFYRAEDYHQDFYLHSAERYKRYEKASGRKDFTEKFK